MFLCLTICNYILYLLDFLYLRFEKDQIFSRPQEPAAAERQKIVDALLSRNARAAKKVMRGQSSQCES